MLPSCHPEKERVLVQVRKATVLAAAGMGDLGDVCGLGIQKVSIMAFAREHRTDSCTDGDGRGYARRLMGRLAIHESRKGLAEERDATTMMMTGGCAWGHEVASSSQRVTYFRSTAYSYHADLP